MACRLCGNEDASQSKNFYFSELYEYLCPICGMYAIKGTPSTEFYEKAKFIASEKRLRQEDAYLIHDLEENQLDALKKHFSNKYSLINWKEFINDFPENHKIPDRALLNLGIASKKFGQEIVLTSIDHLPPLNAKGNISFFLLFTEKDCVTYVLESLQEKNYIQYTNKDGNIFKNTQLLDSFLIFLQCFLTERISNVNAQLLFDDSRADMLIPLDLNVLKYSFWAAVYDIFNICLAIDQCNPVLDFRRWISVVHEKADDFPALFNDFLIPETGSCTEG